MDLGFTGKTVFVSGASGGIGQAVARGFAAESANVVVHYHTNRAAAETLTRELGQQSALAVQADLTDQSQVAQAFERVADRFGSIEILVANAGIWPPDHVSIADMAYEQWLATLDANLNSVFLSCRQFLRQAIERKIDDPSIVLIGSTAAVFGEAGHGDYATSKSGLAYGFMLSLKNEMARAAGGGRINTVCPGWTVTPMASKFVDDGQSIKRALSTIALRKVASPEDIAHAVMFLASSHAAGHITGQVLTVSGGMEGRKLYDASELDVARAVPSPSGPSGRGARRAGEGL